MTSPDRLPLSVILATIEPPPWPDLVSCLEVLAPQVAAVGGEIIVGDGHGAALGESNAVDSLGVSWVRIPGASVFELRARAVERARGEIIALTEDHCLVGRDWCQQILNAFSSHPNVMGVSGPVLNGSTDHQIDQANFLHTFASSISPEADTASTASCSPAECCSRTCAGSWPDRSGDPSTR